MLISLIYNTLNLKIKLSIDIQQQTIIFQQNLSSEIFNSFSIIQVINRLKIPIDEEKGGIPLQIAQQLKTAKFNQKKKRLCLYFPKTKSYFQSLNQEKVEEFLDVIIERANTKRYNTQCKKESQFIKKQQKIKLCLDFLPLMKNQIKDMSYEDLQQLYLEVMRETNRQKNKSKFKFQPIEKHPFQIKLLNKNTLQPRISIHQLIQNIKKQQPSLFAVIKDVQKKLIKSYQKLQKKLVQMQKIHRSKGRSQLEAVQKRQVLQNHGQNYFSQMNIPDDLIKQIQQTNKQQLIFYYDNVEKRTYQEMIASNSQKDQSGQVIYSQQVDCQCQRKPKVKKMDFRKFQSDR